MQKTLSDIANFLFFPTDTPKPYDSIHIISLVFTVFLTVFLIRITKHASKRGKKRLFLVMSCILIAGELYKQFVLSFRGGGFAYNFYFFPMQFCSTPLYVYPIAFFARNEKLYEGAVFYSATYCLFAGALVLIYPASALCDSGAINIQSLLHHAIMVAVGIALLSRLFGRFTKSGIICGAGIFLFFLSVAIGMNLVLGERVNMYYLNPLSPVRVPLISALSDVLPFPTVPLLYAVIFTAVALFIGGVLPKKKKATLETELQ